MKEYLKIAISLCTLLIVACGFLFTINQVRSYNEIMIENNRINIIASFDPVALAKITGSQSATGAGQPGPDENKFLLAMFNHYINVYRIHQSSHGIYGPLSDSYIAAASGGFCLWLSFPVAKDFWRKAVRADTRKRSKGKLQGGVNLSKIEDEWCINATDTG